jgi:hypothetical protein
MEMKQSENKNYGYSEKYPIQVGGVYQGDGVTREYDYLAMLEGPEKQKIKTKRIGSCCEFTYGFNQIGLLDKYGVTYDGFNDTVYLYIDMYRIDSLPKIPKGFKLREIQQNKKK